MKTKLTFLFILMLVFVIGIQPAIAKKPLTTITFNELPYQPVNNLSISGVTFHFTVNGVESNEANFGSIGPVSPTNYVQHECIEGPTVGELTLIFDKPTTDVQFGVVLSTSLPIEDAVVVDLHQPGRGWLRETIIVAASADPQWTEGLFSYQGPAVDKVVINFAEIPSVMSRFALDNLVFHKHPSA